jgi:protein O-GlcNAc transferase
LNEALLYYQKSLDCYADNATALSNMGIILVSQGKRKAAITCFQKAVTIKPDFLEAYSNLGNALREQGQLTAAAASMQKALAINPDDAGALRNFGITLKEQGKFAEAITTYKKAIRIKPDFAEAHYNLGNVLLEQKRLEEAIASYKKVIALKPDYGDSLNNLGNALRSQGNLAEAIVYFKQAIANKPNYADAISNLGATLKDQGKLFDAIVYFKKALANKPDYVLAHSNLLLTMHYLECDPGELFNEHKSWNARHVAHLPGFKQQKQWNPEQKKRLRIGFISSDFRTHSVSYFLKPLFDSHDRQKLAFYCYSNSNQEDNVTLLLRKKTEGWQNIVGISDLEVATMIRRDGIDILIDLAGHTKGNRLPIFARKPAPVQVTWLGYPNTTGMTSMDYRFTDKVADPPGLADRLNVEKLFRLPNGFLCYQPFGDTPAVAPSPVQINKHVTFVSFNNLSKISVAVIEVWAKILKAVPNSKLLIKNKSLNCQKVRRRYKSLFKKQSIDSQRLIFLHLTPSTHEHLATYGQGDISLDTFPYNGTTTTCEALWMGVPVIVMRGDRHASRVGASLLNQVGLEELIGEDVNEYIEKAVSLAKDRPRLKKLRQGMRTRMEQSPLCDGKGFAGQIATAFDQMWQTWLDSPDKTPGSDPPLAVRKLHIGGSQHLAQWEQFNIQPGAYVDHVGDAADLSRFPDHCFGFIYASHVLEYFDHVKTLDTVLAEWLRVLRPGGKLYVSVPDLATLGSLLESQPTLTMEERLYIMGLLFGKHENSVDFSKTGFDEQILGEYLRRAGFYSLQRIENFGICNDSSTVRIQGIPASLNMVAMKPIKIP